MRQITLVLLLCLMISPVLAQEDTPEPTPDFDFLPEDYFAFPQSLLLRLTLPIDSEQVQRLILLIQPEGRENILIEFPAQQPFEFKGDYTVARYRWTITPDTAPPLFGTIRYTWRLVTTSNQTHQMSRTLDYTDSRVAWQTLEGDTFSLTLPYSSQGMNLSLSMSQLNATSALLKKNTGQTVAFKWLVFAPDLPPGCRLDEDGNPVVQNVNDELAPADIPCDVVLANRVYTDSGYTTLVLEREDSLQSRLLREIISGYHAPLWANRDVPAWFRSGIERLYVSPGSQALAISRQALRSGTALSLAEMAAFPESDTGNTWAAQSYGMVLYMMDRIGVEPVFALARVSPETPFAEAYQAAMGLSPDALVSDWQTWLFTSGAAAAYGYNVFAASTPTPTITFTPSKTRTPLPPTDTPTITPDYSPTPRPSRTPIPPTLTLTPLPAQSFSLRSTPLPPTPVPLMEQQVTVAGVSLKTAQVVIIVVVGVLVLILVMVGLFWRRR